MEKLIVPWATALKSLRVEFSAPWGIGWRSQQLEERSSYPVACCGVLDSGKSFSMFVVAFALVLGASAPALADCGWQQKQVCGGVCCGGSGGYAAPNYYQQQQQAIQMQQQQAEQQRQAAEAARIERERQAELDRQQQKAEQRRQQEEAENQAKFNRDKAEALSTLKGSLGTSITSNSSGSSELKGTLTDTGIKNLQADQKSRDLEGSHAAWKQLHCAASIAFDAVSALQASLNDPRHDTSEFKYLSGEASNALNGARLGVECPPAPAYPSHEVKAAAMNRGKAVTRKILDRAAKVADRIAQVPSSSSDASATATPKATVLSGDDGLSKLRAEQAALNRNQRRKYDPTSQASINREQKEKKEIARLIQDAKKVETGDFSISLDGAKR